MNISVGCDEWRRGRERLARTATMTDRRAEENLAKGGSVFGASARCADGISARHYDKLPRVDETVIREANIGDAAGIAHVHVASWRTTYRGIVPDSFLDAMSHEESERRWRERLGGERTFSFVAEVSGEVVGFAVGGSRRSESLAEYGGELYALYLLAESRGTGIGRRLFRKVAEGLSSFGYRAMLAWVMAENRSACGFYEGMGGRLVGRDVFEIEGAEIEEVAYGWDDVREFVKAPS